MTIISNEELSTQAYKKVKDMIISGYLKPGQKIVQDKLAEELGISRTPLRSALQMLVNDFLIESLPKRGMIVKDFTDQEILEIYDCRIAFTKTLILFFMIASSNFVEIFFCTICSKKEIF
jgi:DNA-binding GntR family transcriptional regulator